MTRFESVLFWTDVVFPPLMIMLPVVLTWCVPRSDDRNVDEAELRNNQLALWFSTFFMLVLLSPIWNQLGREFVRFAFLLSLLPGFYAFRVIRIKNSDVEPIRSADVRSASLVRRRSPISTRVSALPAVVWLAGTVAVAIRFATVAHDVTIPMWMAGALQLVGVVFVLGGPLTARVVMSESEPADSAGSPELAAAYARHRNVRVWGMYGVFFLMTVVLSAVNIVVAWVPGTVGLYVWFVVFMGGLAPVAGLSALVYNLQRWRIHRTHRVLVERGTETGRTREA